jgi:hypothetical protein
MNKNIKLGLGVTLVVLVVLTAVFIVKKEKDTDMAMVPVDSTPVEQQNQANNADYSVPKDNDKDRTPKRFACVGEYCDGSMSGELNFTTIKIPLVDDGGNVGCGARIFFAPHTVPKTTAVLDATYKLLFDIKPVPEIPEDNFRNTLGAYTKLFYDSVTLNNGTAKLYLTGSMYGPGHCAEPEVRAQIDQAALQYDSVKKLEVYLNGQLFNWCSMDVSDGEGPCPEKPQYWTANK